MAELTGRRKGGKSGRLLGCIELARGIAQDRALRTVKKQERGTLVIPGRLRVKGMFGGVGCVCLSWLRHADDKGY